MRPSETPAPGRAASPEAGASSPQTPLAKPAPLAEPAPQLPGATHLAILAAARRQLAAGEELSINRVAAEAGVARQTVHYHFGGLRGLRAALAAEGLGEPAAEEPTEDRLLDAAVRLLSQPGGGVVSIEAIAEEAGLTKGAVYHHFADRSELMRSVARRVSPVDEIIAGLESVDQLPLREALIALATVYYVAMSKRGELIRNLAANASRDPELVPLVMGEVLGRGVPLVTGWLAEIRARGEIRDDADFTLLVQAIVGPVFMALVLGRPLFDRVAQFGIRVAVDNVEDYVDQLIRGVAPQPVPSVNGAPALPGPEQSPEVNR